MSVIIFENPIVMKKVNIHKVMKSKFIICHLQKFVDWVLCREQLILCRLKIDRERQNRSLPSITKPDSTQSQQRVSRRYSEQYSRKNYRLPYEMKNNIFGGLIILYTIDVIKRDVNIISDIKENILVLYIKKCICILQYLYIGNYTSPDTRQNEEETYEMSKHGK